MLIGPGRWGSINAELGVPVTYGDIYNACALVEVLPAERAPEPSYGTHFFQDLVEARIYPLTLALGDPETIFQPGLLLDAPNCLARLFPNEAEWEPLLKVVDLTASPLRSTLELAMDGEAGVAVAYLKPVA